MRRLLFLLPMLFVSVSLADSYGPIPPGTVTNDSSDGVVTWANPDRVKLDDTNYATSTLGFDNISSYILKCTNFGFNVPTGATINGIGVSVKRFAVLFDGSIRDYKVRLIRAGTTETTDKSNVSGWETSDTSVNYGGAADLWSASWTPSDVNNSGFGIAFQAISVGNTDIDTAQVNYITITLNCTPSCTGQGRNGGIIDEDLP